LVDVAEPDFDRCDGEGAVEDVVAFVIPGGYRAELLPFVDAPLDGVAAAVLGFVEGRRAPAALPLRLRLARWSSGSAMVALMPRRRR
jgi:hypothetical protein